MCKQKVGVSRLFVLFKSSMLPRIYFPFRITRKGAEGGEENGCTVEDCGLPKLIARACHTLQSKCGNHDESSYYAAAENAAEHR